MRILPLALVLTALLGLTASIPARPVRAKTPHLPAFTAAYRETATHMLATGCPYATWAAHGRRFLFFDPAGGGRAAEVLGDLATATRIAILVPGVDTTLADFDRGLGGVPRRAPGVQARALHDLLAKRDPHTAVIAWLGYDPPEGVGPAAATEGRARVGAAALSTFVGDLRSRRPGATVTLIGHSYGAVVVGLAAKNKPGIDDVITLGAPGAGVDRAAELGGARVWAALAPTDWIRRIPQVRLFGLGLGRRPSSPGFGASALPTDGVAGHDFYLVPGSVTLRAVADVVLTGGPRHDRPGHVS
ncbi:alpha/beta hydrolase [Actinoplanes sp. M2I2]|uniref:alpha/beta hydrolase n=1 Tax=Actinoplanes sp. M2I2 TaxID=1734444 RepID=UPI0020204240|nr:alpha/beta hydrolase [Actinoplanes sp. M2I2]